MSSSYTQVGQPLSELQAKGTGLDVLLGPASDYADVRNLAHALRSNRCVYVFMLHV